MQKQYFQYPLPFSLPPEDKSPVENSEVISNSNNSISPEDRAFHDWYRFVLSFPPHLVRDYINNFELDEGAIILDPFCGTGTTIVEAKLNRMRGLKKLYSGRTQEGFTNPIKMINGSLILRRYNV